MAIDPDVKRQLDKLKKDIKEDTADMLGLFTTVQSDLNGLVSDVVALGERVAALEATPPPPVDTKPTISDQAFDVREDADVGDAIGTVVASRAQTFVIVSGNDAGALSLHPETGVLTVAAALDAADVAMYSLVVRVKNAFGTAEAAVNLMVHDVDQTTPPPPPPPPPNVDVFNVGPGQTYASLGSLPWMTFDEKAVEIRLHYKATPYREKFLIRSDHVTLRGVLGPNGERPIVDGGDAVATQGHDPIGEPIWEQRGLIMIGNGKKSPKMWPSIPQHITIQNLEVRNGHQDHTFTSESGDVLRYWNNAGGIYIERGGYVTIQNCYIHHCGNGIFGAHSGSPDGGDAVHDVLIEDCLFDQNGNVDSDREHHTYLESLRITYRRCVYKSVLRHGEMLKDRSGFVTIEECTFDGTASRMIGLVEPEDGGAVISKLEDWDKTLITGCTIRHPSDGAWAPITFGGDFGVQAWYRKTLEIVNTTIEMETDRAKSWRHLFIQCATDNDAAIDVTLKGVTITRPLAPGATAHSYFILVGPDAIIRALPAPNQSRIEQVDPPFEDGGTFLGKEFLLA